MLHIDGTQGEGGGQVLRTALSLSLITSTPVRIEGIRGRRKSPGLQRDHLTCVQAAKAIGSAEVEGAELGSTTLQFTPRQLHAGDFGFAIGAAGSTSLLLQTILMPLLLAPGASTVRLDGGTHNPQAPPFDFLAHTFAPALRRLGADLDVQIARHGFAPSGGGSIAVRIAGGRRLQPYAFDARTTSEPWRARALLSQLPDDIGRRELVELVQRFGRSRLRPENARIERVDATGAGNALLLELPFPSHCEVVTAFGERGVPAEQIADRVATEALVLLAAEAPVGQHLADQLLVPLALAGGGAMRTVEPSLHSTTVAALVERFLPVRFRFVEDDVRRGTWVVECRPN